MKPMTTPLLERREEWRQSRALFLLAVSSGTILNPLNSSMISMALHGIQHAYGLSFAAVSWVISAFYISSAAGQPVMGRLGDVFGRKRVFLAGLAIAFIPAVAAPFVSMFSLLLVLRVLQAIGTSAIYPSGMGLVRRYITERQAAALAVISVFSSVTVAIGPTVGGFLIPLGGWESIFTVNIPFLFLSFLLAWTIFPRDEQRRSSLREVLPQLDIPGILLFAAALLLLLSFVLSFKTGIKPLLGIGGGASLLLFIRRELRLENPFINLRMFRDHMALTRVNVLFILLNIYNYSLLFGLPAYLQDELKLGLEGSGLLMLFISAFGIVVSPLTGKWVDRSGVLPPLFLGAGCMLIGAVSFAFFLPALGWKGLIPVLSVMGTGYGFQNVSLQTAMLRAAPPGEIGVASGLFQTSRYLGAIASSVLIGSLFAADLSARHVMELGLMLLLATLLSLLLSVRLMRSLR
ncbi:MFS transporter [Ectobacillus ponti]|uniref:MFS transporter n=1 Tax=Ectobacillus ponti TaxID=2961894 RepID=A0AA41X9I6_9BACI|nr:MFS transporter [Ectobacillus ponti]MCP8969648.1 MFS transporter [Ectobacillus ponti]